MFVFQSSANSSKFLRACANRIPKFLVKKGGCEVLIKLNDGCYVAADQVAEIRVKDHGGLCVRMKDGVRHHVGADYGKSDYATQDRLVKEVNKAKTGNE